MRILELLLLAIAALAMLQRSASARTWRVLEDGSGDAPFIQAGIDSAAGGDTVLVGPGRYLENLSIVAKDLVLKSDQGPVTTIIDGSNEEDTVIHLFGQTRVMVLEGFTITGGTGRQRSTILIGGGIALEGGASPVIRGNHIVDNGVVGKTRFGGGLGHLSSSSPRIERNYFGSNYADLGGGVEIVSGTTEIVGNEFRNNEALLDGGAIYADFNSGSVTIEDNQFWDNFAGDHGGAVVVAGSTESEVFLLRNFFSHNSAGGSARDGAAGAAIWVVRLSGIIANNTLVENTGPSWDTCGGGGLSLQSTAPELDIYANIIALNRSCGITCASSFPDPQNTLGNNLLWMNIGGDIGQGKGACPSAWTGTQLIADPLFCGPELGNYTVSIESPALTGPIPFGVWVRPGCGPGVHTEPTTWGRIKALHR